MESLKKACVFIFVVLVFLHSTTSVPPPAEEPEFQSHRKAPRPYPAFLSERQPEPPRADKSDPQAPLYVPYRPYPPVYFNPKHYFDEGRLAAAAVHNVNLRDLFKPLLASSDSSRLTQYIDSVINRFNMRSAKPPPAQQKEIENNVQLSLDAGLEKFKNAFKSENAEEKSTHETITEASAASPGTSNSKGDLKNQVMNKTDALLERLGIINKNKHQVTKEKDDVKEIVQRPSPATTTNIIENAIQTYPYDIYSNLKKLHDSSLNSSPKGTNVADILKELEEVTRKNGISDISGLTYIFNDILSKYRAISTVSSDKMNAFYDILSQTRNTTSGEGNGSTKSALFEIEIPFYYPEAKMPSFKHIAGATALGALALGALFATPLGTGILRRYDNEKETEDKYSWLESLAFWKNNNNSDNYASEEDYDYNSFHELYNPYYQLTRDIYNQNYDYQNYYGYNNNENTDNHYRENNNNNDNNDNINNNNNNNDVYYEEDKPTYDKQNDKDHRWYSTYNYNAHPYQFIVPERPSNDVRYDTTKNENTYSEAAYNSRIRPAVAIPLSLGANTQSFNVQDSYTVQERGDESGQSVVSDYRQTQHEPQDNFGETTRYVTVEEVNRIAEDALKQILQNYQIFLAGGIDEEAKDNTESGSESSYSSIASDEYSTDWKPRLHPSLNIESRASALVAPESEPDSAPYANIVPPAPVEPPVEVEKSTPKRISRKRPSSPVRRRKLTRQKDKGEKIDQGNSDSAVQKKNVGSADDYDEEYMQRYQREKTDVTESKVTKS